MAKFVYSMQNILTIKYKLEEQAKAEFSMANLRLRESEERLFEFCRRQKGYEEEWRESVSPVFSLLKIRELSQAVNQMKQRIEEQKQIIVRQELQVEEARQRLNEVMKERKTHEKLKERAWEVFLQAINEEEKKEIDELVSYTYHDRNTDEED